MRYMGGKTRIARHLTAAICMLTPRRDRLIEPFCGAGWMTAQLAPHFGQVLASDQHCDLILMWNALLLGWLPPDDITETEYKTLRHAPPSALRGFAGFACSFGGGWFKGYARGENRNYTNEARKGLLKKLATIKPNTTFHHRSFEQTPILPGDVVYCDPPYTGTTGYDGKFSHTLFWSVMDGWARLGATVFVSETLAPPDWAVVWERAQTMNIDNRAASRTRVERLFYKGPTCYP